MQTAIKTIKAIKQFMRVDFSFMVQTFQRNFHKKHCFNSEFLENI